MSNCIPFTQSWHSLSAWKMAVAAGQVKQIWFHSYLVTVRFLSPAAGCNRIRLVPLGLGRNLLPSRAGDGRREPWLTVAGGGSVGSGLISSLLERERGMDGWRGGAREVGKGEINKPAECWLSAAWAGSEFPLFPFHIKRWSTALQSQKKTDILRQIL